MASPHFVFIVGTLSPAENDSMPSCMTATTAQSSDLYVYDVYSIPHMSDILCLFFVYLFKSRLTKVLASKDFLHGHMCVCYTVV